MECWSWNVRYQFSRDMNFIEIFQDDNLLDDRAGSMF